LFTLKLNLEEQQLIQELENLKKQEEEAKGAVEKQQTVRAQLEKEEEKYWREYTKHRRDLLLSDDEARSLECQLLYTRFDNSNTLLENLNLTILKRRLSLQFKIYNG